MNGNNGLVNYKYMQAGQSVSQMADAQIKRRCNPVKTNKMLNISRNERTRRSPYELK